MSARVAAIVLLLLAATACGTPATPPASGDDAERRSALRDSLRASLGSRYEEPVPAATPDELRNGAQLYDQLCRACHGAGGKGNGPSAQWLLPKPASLVDPESATFFSDRAQLEIIEKGIPATAMIGWADVLDATDRRNVFLHVRSMRVE